VGTVLQTYKRTTLSHITRLRSEEDVGVAIETIALRQQLAARNCR
jgi:hypothetical protein